jgi:NADH-quinone oxidoreductase subunit A
VSQVRFGVPIAPVAACPSGTGAREATREGRKAVRFDFAVVLIYLSFSFALIGIALWLTRLVGPRIPDPEKGNVYECGERTIGSGRFNFNPRFYLMALVFIIFDVEIALTFPVATVVRGWVAEGKGLVAVVEIVLFLAVLAGALAYVWGRGDLEWVRDIDGQLVDTGAPSRPPDPAASPAPSAPGSGEGTA